MQEIGIIGGTGVYSLDGIEIIQEHNVDTPFGQPSSPIIEAMYKGVKVYFLPRHGKQHSILPHEINYLANIYALKQIGVSYLISVSAVGSLKEELPPQTFVLPDQFIDWTKGKRERSFFGGGLVGHVSCAEPVELKLMEMIAASCTKAEIKFKSGGSYLCIEGPQFSTRAESSIYRSFGASVIGMTNVPECYLAKEAGMAYATVAMVTDYDCWKEEHCTVEEIMKVVSANNESVQRLLSDLIPSLNNNKFQYTKENEGFAIMTAREMMTSTQQQIVDVLRS